MPQIGRDSPLCTSCATTVPICLESAAPTVVGHAVPERLTQSIPSSFVKKIGRLKPAAFVARKFEQKRW